MNSDVTVSYLSDEYINRLDQLGEALKEGDKNLANNLIGDLTTLRESVLFQELGKLTREIHDSMNAFTNDERVVKLTHEEIPDAKERLTYIITKTNEAAHRTMEGTEAVMGVINGLQDQANDIRSRWSQFRTGELSKSDFLALGDDMDSFLSSIDEHSLSVHSRLNDIMLAQDYQDLTGQMIRQVIEMVKEVEEKMVRLVAISGAKLSEGKEHDGKGVMANGPQLPSADKQQVATNQDEVDDLLASMGF